MAIDTGTAYPWALIIAEVVEYERGNVRVRVTGPDGEDRFVDMDTSSVAPLTDDVADEIAGRFDIDVPR